MTGRSTEYARLSDDGEVLAERTDLKFRVRVRYEVVPGVGATKVIILSAPQDGARKTNVPSDARQDVDPPANADRDESEWGNVISGLRARVVPVLSSMSEDAIDLTHGVEKFEKPDDVAFAFELENVSDQPVRLVDVYHETRNGEPIANADWLSQFVFLVDSYGSDGRLIRQPKIEIDDVIFFLHEARVTTLEPGQSQRFLIKPAQWLPAFRQPIHPKNYRVALRYRWMTTPGASQTIRKDSALLEAAAVDVVSAAVAIEVGGETRKADLVWGEAINGLRAALSIEPSKESYMHGEKPAVRLHLKNVGKKPLKLISDLSMPHASVTFMDDKGAPVEPDDLRVDGRLTTGLRGLITLTYQQVIVLDVGQLGLAITEARASRFDATTQRTLIAPAGQYSVQLETTLKNVPHARWVEGQENVPVKDAWVGDLRTGVTPFEIKNETIECNIIDAVTEKPVVGTTVNFRFIKPKSGDEPEEIVADMFWGPQSPSRIVFGIPDDVLRHADREVIEVEWGVGGHADYEPFVPKDRIPLKAFFHEGTKAIREALRTVKLTPKKNADEASSPAPSASLNIKYEMPGAEAETRIFVQRIDPEFQARHGRRDELEYGTEVYRGIRFSRLKNGDSLTLRDLPVGNYQVSRYRLVDIVREGMDRTRNSVYLDRQWIELGEQETKSVNQSRPAGQSITGRVVIPADLKVNTLVVHVCSENARSSGSLNHREVQHFDALNADSDGNFKTEPLPPGKYKIIVEGYANHSLANSGIILPSWEGTARVTVTESNKPAAIELTLHEFDRDAWRKDQEATAKENSQARTVADKTIKFAKLREPAFRLPGRSNIECVGYDNNDNELVVVSTYHLATVRRWDLVGKKLISDITLSCDQHLRPFRQGTFKLSGDRRRVTGATDEFVGIWDTATGELLQKLPFPTRDGIYDCAIDKLDCTPDLSVIVGNWSMPGRLTLVYDAHVIVWDGTSGKVLQTVIDKHATTLTSIDLSTDGKLLATTNGGGAKVWEMSTGKMLRSFPNNNTGRKHSDPDVSNQYTSHVWSVQFSPNGQRLAVGDILGVKLWDAHSGELQQQIDAPYRYGLPDLVFPRNGQQLARTGAGGRGQENVVSIWSTQTGEKLFELDTKSVCGAFSDDNQQLAVGLTDRQMALAVFQLSGSATDTPSPPPESTKDKMQTGSHYRGKKAEEFIDNWKPVWGESQLGIQYGIALTTPRRQFKVGERIPLAVFFRNVSDKPQQLDHRPDFFLNTPQVINANGEAVELSKVGLLGTAPHYRDNLQPGEAFGPLYGNFGLGDNPRPGHQSWAPYYKSPAVGEYKLTHSLAFKVAGPDVKSNDTSDDWKAGELTSGTLEFEIVEGDKPFLAGHQPAIEPASAVTNGSAGNEEDKARVTKKIQLKLLGGDQAIPQPLDEPEKELASLQGIWKFDTIQTDGWPKTSGKRPERNGHGDDLQWVIKGNEITRTSRDGEEAKLSFTIDPTKAPRHIDVTFLSGPHKGQKCLGMYERSGLGGVVLWFCLTDPGSQAPRPTDVSYSTNEGRTMIGLIRVAGATTDDGKGYAVPNEDEIGSGLIPGDFGGVSQSMRIVSDGSISYSDAKNLCQMTLFEDERLKVGFQNDNEIWTDVTLPLVTGSDGQQRAVWSAELDGYVYRVTAIPFSSCGCLFRLEKWQDDKLVHGSLEFYAVKSKQGDAEEDKPATPIDHHEWRVDQRGTGIVAGNYAGASQRMQIANDGTISYNDRPHGICHVAVLEDDRLTATFRDARGMPTEITLPLVTTAAEQRAFWSVEIDGHTLRATAIPFSDNVYVFRLEKYLDDKLIEGEEQFYAIDQKLREATP